VNQWCPLIIGFPQCTAHNVANGINLQRSASSVKLTYSESIMSCEYWTSIRCSSQCGEWHWFTGVWLFNKFDSLWIWILDFNTVQHTMWWMASIHICMTIWLIVNQWCPLNIGLPHHCAARNVMNGVDSPSLKLTYSEYSTSTLCVIASTWRSVPTLFP